MQKKYQKIKHSIPMYDNRSSMPFLAPLEWWESSEFVRINSYTLLMFYKGQSIWDGRQIFEKNKGQGLALSHILRDI